jgi:type IV pilus biogenesis protein CpaD/CtpE
MTRIRLVLLVMAVAGCASSDPYRRTDVWAPTGSNAGNIAAMVADPNDLIHGRSDNTGDALQAVGAIDRVRQDRAKPLTGLSDTAAPAASAPPAAGAPPAASAAAPAGPN